MADEAPLPVREIGSFLVGGRAVTLRERPARGLIGDPGQQVNLNGDFALHQMYVQYVTLADPRGRYPILLWHGGSLTGAVYETTPDERPGWQSSLLRRGHSVYVVDAPGHGRASWARYPELEPREPTFRSHEALWTLLRLGPPGSYAADPAGRRPYPGTRFPVAHFDQFAKQTVPRFAVDPVEVQAAYDALIQRVGPCVVLTHSAAGQFGLAAAPRPPGLVRGVISIEPSGGPDPDAVNLASLREIPHLFVWGDFLDRDEQRGVWEPLVRSTARYHAALVASGASSKWIDLPARGIRGNSHLLMADTNANEIATLIDDWMRRNGLIATR
jgi:pimeloyl-ACP methyl ester carboxylesterase